jgi:hypothetical protein
LRSPEYIAQKGFSAFFGAGVAHGRPNVTLDVPADIVAEAGQELQDRPTSGAGISS